MRQIINNKIYDTENAEFVAEYWNGYSNSDFNFLRESLYRSAKGQWFIAGIGGAKSRYAQSFGNGCSGGSAIRLLTRTKAWNWLAYHQKRICNFDEILEEYFKDIVTEG